MIPGPSVSRTLALTWLPVSLVFPFPSLKLPSQKKTETRMSLTTRVKQSEVWEYGFSEGHCFLRPESHINHSKAYSDLWSAIVTVEWFPMKARHGEGQQAVQLWGRDKSKMILSYHPNVLTLNLHLIQTESNVCGADDIQRSLQL